VFLSIAHLYITGLPASQAEQDYQVILNAGLPIRMTASPSDAPTQVAEKPFTFNQVSKHVVKRRSQKNLAVTIGSPSSAADIWGTHG
jgi:hypothetical protein